MNGCARVSEILHADPLRWRLLDVVRELGLPDGWVGAGFVRNAVWDHLHQRSPSPPVGDVDVIYYDAHRIDPAEDLRIEAALRAAEPSVRWSVKNQARMHHRNGDGPYACAVDAMRHWPETATAVAARWRSAESCEIAAPFGLDDLLTLVLRPTPRFSAEKRHIYEERLRQKNWATSWPLLRKVEA